MNAYVNYCLGCNMSPTYEDFGRECSFVINEVKQEDYVLCRFFCKTCKPVPSGFRPTAYYVGFKHNVFTKDIADGVNAFHTKKWKAQYTGLVVDLLYVTFKYDKRPSPDWEINDSF